EYEGYEHGEALVVSSWEPEESLTQNSGDARDGGESWDFGLGVSEGLVERSFLLLGGEHGGCTLVETQFEVESSNSGRQSTLT
ncbi:hypothetical protein A2U01_0090670, partial [Trifolium medium]|nr:hypothetical protein [Trifolium medium]